MEQQDKEFRPILDKKTQTKIDIGLTIIYFASIIALIVFYHNSDDNRLCFTFFFFFSGLTIGAMIGLLSTPFSDDEEIKFGNLKSAVVGFFSGYVLCKLSPVFDRLGHEDGLLSTDSIVRLMVLTCGLIVGFMGMLVYRRYYIQGKDIWIFKQKK